IYHDKKTTFHDSVVVLSYYKQLRPRTRVYTDSNGISELLLCIYGKPEIGSPVPLLIWIPKSYPLEHPIVYIDLESLKDAKVSPGEHVDPNGLITLPIFGKWNADTCNLLHVVQECIKICRYDHVIDPVAPGDSNTYLTLPPKLPPNPVEEIPKPPLPKKTGFLHSTSNDNILPSNIPSKATPEPRLAEVPPVLPKKPQPAHSLDLLDSVATENADNTHKAVLGDLQHALNQMSEADLAYINENLQNRKLSIASAQRQFESMYRYETDSLKNIRESIELTKASLQGEISLIKRHFDKIELYEKENGEEIDPSSLVTAQNPALNQLYESVARDYALSDTMHVLARLLNRDAVNLDVFVKKTRQLGREQFFTRMHIQNIIERLRQ
ncbi:suppressor protein STP22 of temperature-sensitive alpha-factor receptor and arginine permease, partial [Zygosaccharomyces rouxii]